jgi:hypothetical protein
MSSLFFGGIRVQTQGIALAKRVLYHLRHTPSPFHLRYFVIGSHVYDQASLHHDLPMYPSHVRGKTGTATMPAYWLRWGPHKLFA